MGTRGYNLASLLTGCVILEKFLNPSMLWFPYLFTRNIGTDFSWGFVKE